MHYSWEALEDRFRIRIKRRNFVKSLVWSGLASAFANPVLAAVGDFKLFEKSISIYNPNTKESINTVYCSNGQYKQEALTAINHIMRDYRTGEIKPIDPRLLDLIYSIGIKIGTQEPFHVISGYRSPKTNALLRKRGKGAAKKSYHIKGQAVDIRLPGCRLSTLRKTAFKLKGGGVGYYPRLRFVHVDVGPVRFWNGCKKKKSS